MNKVTVGDVVYIIDDETYTQIESICNKGTDDIFARHPYGTHYHYIDTNGGVGDTIETGSKYDELLFKAANYCTDYVTLYDRSIVELFTRSLWRYGEQNGTIIDPKSESGIRCWGIDWSERGPYVALHIGRTPGAIYFKTEEAAKDALEDIVIPFIANYPQFSW